MNSQVIQTPIKFSIKTNNLDNIHKKVDKPLLKTTLSKPSSKLIHSNDIFTTMNFHDESEIEKSKSDKPLVNGVPLIKKHSASNSSSKKDVTLKRSIETNSTDEMASKMRKCDNPEDTIIIESESSSKLVIHPLKNVKIIQEPISSSNKDVETVSAIFKALEEKISNIDKICKTNQQNNTSKIERKDSKHSVNVSNTQEKSSKIVMKVNSNKCVVENKKLFSEEDFKEDRKHEESRKITSKSDKNSRSNLKSLKESLIKERKRSNELNQEKTKSLRRDSKENERKSRDNKNESYKTHSRREREKHGKNDNRYKRKSREKSTKKAYTTLGEEIKSQSSRDSSKDFRKLNLIIKDEYHSRTTCQSTIDLSEQVLEDSFKLSNKKPCPIKDKSKITENIKKLLDRKNTEKLQVKINESDQLAVPSVSENEQNLIAPNSFEPTISNSFSTSFQVESLDDNNDNDEIHSKQPDNSTESSSEDVASKPCPPSSSFFVKTANISFKISPKKMQIGNNNVFSQPIEQNPTETNQQQVLLPSQELTVLPFQLDLSSTFKIPFNIDKKLKKTTISPEESLNIEQEKCDLDSKNVENPPIDDCLEKQETVKPEETEMELSTVEINDLPSFCEPENEKVIEESLEIDTKAIDNSKEQQISEIKSEIPELELSKPNDNESLVEKTAKIEVKEKDIKTEEVISTKLATVEPDKPEKIEKKHEGKSRRENLKENQEKNKSYSTAAESGSSRKEKDKRDSKRVSRSHSPSRNRVSHHSRNQRVSRERNRSNSRNRLKCRRKESRDHSKSRKRSKRRSSSKKSIVNYSRSRRKYSNDRYRYRDDQRQKSRSKQQQQQHRSSTNHSRVNKKSGRKSRERSKSDKIKSRKQSSSGNNHRSRVTKEDSRFLSKNRSKERSKSRKNSEYKAKRRRDDSSSRSSSNEDKRGGRNRREKTCKSKLISRESVENNDNAKLTKGNTIVVKREEDNSTKSVNNDSRSVVPEKEKEKKEKEVEKKKEEKVSCKGDDDEKSLTNNREDCPVTNPGQESSHSNSNSNLATIPSESANIIINNDGNDNVVRSEHEQEVARINICETPAVPVGIVSEQLEQSQQQQQLALPDEIAHAAIPIRITSTVSRDPRHHRDGKKSKSAGNSNNNDDNNCYYLKESAVVQPQQNNVDKDHFKSDDNRNNISGSIIQPPPPPPPLPHFQVSVPSYNTIPFDQNAYLNSFNNFNFDLTSYYVRNTAQCNSLNSPVPPPPLPLPLPLPTPPTPTHLHPQIIPFNATTSFPLSNMFPQQQSYDQSSSSWYVPNEYRTDATCCNQYPINDSFSFPVQPQPIRLTRDNNQSQSDFNDCNYRNYEEIDPNVSFNSTFSNAIEDIYYETMRYNNSSTTNNNNNNKKSSTSSLMNEVMDMDLASESCKSIDSHKVVDDANDQMSDKDDLSSCGDYFQYEIESPLLDPFERFPSAPKPKYEHIIETEVHLSAIGKRFEYAYLKSTVCSCVPPNPDEIKLGKTACGENCFNRSIKVECNRKCPVYELCTNRRFQERIYAPFEPFYCTNGKGWGIRSTNRIYPGTFIIEYVGELIDFQEFLKRIRQKSTYNHHFIMSIQKNMYIDAGCKGNWSRFVNHSCDPNTIIERWVVNGKTRIGFFSKKTIEENEEITIDYQFQQYGMIEQKCFCNSANCTGVMGKLNEKLQDQIKTSDIKIRRELTQKIINRSCLKVINHVSDLITVIKEDEFPDRDTFYGFLEVLLRTDSEDCVRAFIECGGLKIITNFLDIISWNDWNIKLLYLKCLDHFKLKKRTIQNSGQTAIQVVEYWSENPRYSLKHCQEEISLEKDHLLSDNENGQELFSEETLEIDRNNTTIEFTLNDDDSEEQLEPIETEIKDLAINIKQYFATEKQKFYIPKLKALHSDSVTDLNDSESKSKDSASRASSIQGDYVKSRKRRIRRKCTDVIRKLPKDEFRRLFSERHEKFLLEKTQTSTPESISTLPNIDANSSEVFEVVKKLLSNVIIDEINRLKHSDKFATMPIEFQNLDLDKILSDLNIVGQEDIMSLINHNLDENKTSSASTYSNSSSRSLDDNSKSDLNGLVKNSTIILPPNWNSRKADNGQFYYYNIITKITQWEIPVYPWDAGEEDPVAYNFGNASDYQISREDVQIMYEEYKKRYKLQKIEERRKTRLERSIQRKLNLTAGEKNKIEFSKQVFRVVKTIVKPYNTSACKIGRIHHKQDLKFLCEKFADTIIGKEVKLVANLEDLEMNANVQSKIRTYIEKYMANQGRIYKRSSKVKSKSSRKLTLTASSINDCKTSESTNQLHSDFNNSPDFSP